jgi:hypothetical protein
MLYGITKKKVLNKLLNMLGSITRCVIKVFWVQVRCIAAARVVNSDQ